MLTRCRSRRRPPNTRSLTKLIDRIRHNIQQRLDQLLAEVEKLRHALVALDPRGRRTSEPKPANSKPAAKRPARTRRAWPARPSARRSRGSRTAARPSRPTVATACPASRKAQPRPNPWPGRRSRPGLCARGAPGAKTTSGRAQSKRSPASSSAGAARAKPRRQVDPVGARRQRGRDVQVSRRAARPLRSQRRPHRRTDHRLLSDRRALRPHLVRATRTAWRTGRSRTTTDPGPNGGTSSMSRSRRARSHDGLKVEPAASQVRSTTGSGCIDPAELRPEPQGGGRAGRSEG
jgi:hypothetical protein